MRIATGTTARHHDRRILLGWRLESGKDTIGRRFGTLSHRLRRSAAPAEGGPSPLQAPEGKVPSQVSSHAYQFRPQRTEPMSLPYGLLLESRL